MALHVIIGFAGQSSTAEARCIYAGGSKEAARAAMDADTSSVRFECFHNAAGLRKNNPRYVAPAAAAENQSSQETAPGADEIHNLEEAGSTPAPATSLSPATVSGDGAGSVAASDSVPSPSLPSAPPVSGTGRKK